MKWGKYLDSDNCFFSEFSSWLPIRILSYLCLINTKKLVERIGLNLMDLCFKMIEANIDVINCNDINRITRFSFRELQKWYTDVFKTYFIRNFPVLLLFSLCSPIRNFRWVYCWQGKNILTSMQFLFFLIFSASILSLETRRPVWRHSRY